MTTKDFAIGVLSVTTVILFAALLIIQNVAPQQALALGQNERSGDYIVSAAQLDDTAELLLVVEAAQQRMNVYGFNVAAGQIELVQQLDLAPLQRVGQPRPAAPRRER
ncbi:MAG: hypothetical protein HY718_02910 [Planctomycetes bacterium]|nr:hypothetical protein [Planctomycetota bacterium]